MKIEPRLPYPSLTSDEPTGYVESDNDWFENNREAAILNALSFHCFSED